MPTSIWIFGARDKLTRKFTIRVISALQLGHQKPKYNTRCRCIAGSVPARGQKRPCGKHKQSRQGHAPHRGRERELRGVRLRLSASVANFNSVCPQGIGVCFVEIWLSSDPEIAVAVDFIKLHAISSALDFEASLFRVQLKVEENQPTSLF